MAHTTSCIGKREPHHTTILLVEDEPFVLDATSRILRRADFEVLAACDAGEAKHIYQQHRSEIDLVISDLLLPDRNGRQLAQDLRVISPEIPILLTSGYGQAEASVQLLDNATGYLSKPVLESELGRENRGDDGPAATASCEADGVGACCAWRGCARPR